MTDKHYPHAGYDVVGAKYRWGALYGEEPKTAHAALRAYEQESGKRLTLTEKREFFAGWRSGTVSAAMESLKAITRYLSAHDVKALGSDLVALANKYDALRPSKRGRS